MKLMTNLSLAFVLLLSMSTSMATDQLQTQLYDSLIIAEVQTETISEDEAAVIASKATGGKVISSETRGVDGVSVYRFRVLMGDGQVKVIQVKASTGEIL